MPLALLVLTLLMFGGVLIDSGQRILSRQGNSDIVYYGPARQFGFEQLRQGNLATWNPHVFSGAPFFGNIQSAMLYPPNWIYLALPLGLALNLDMTIHFFLAGLFMSLWCRYRGLSPAGAGLAGALFMFSGSCFLRIYAGHLPLLAAIPWIPLLFLSLEAMLDRGELKWILLGILAVTMQLLAGHPQVAYFSGIAAVIYFGILWARSERRLKPCLGFVAIYAGAVAITAMQFLAALETMSEGTRSGGTRLEFASIASLPPENLLTLIVPFVFGDMTSIDYFGRWHLWEASLFFGAGGLALAAYGVAYGEKSLRRFAGPMALLLVILALGAYTPLFKILYACVPGYSLFRVHARFNILVCLFLAMLAGVGFDQLVKTGAVPRKMKIAVLVIGILLAGLAAGLALSASSGGGGLWCRFLKTIDAAGGCFLPASYYQDAAFMTKTGLFASGQIGIASGTVLLIALLMFVARPGRPLAWGLLLVAVLEVFVIGLRTRASMPLHPPLPAPWKHALEKAAEEDRILDWNLKQANLGMVVGLENIWGYDPTVSKRYAEFMSATQGIPPDQATHKLKFKRIAKQFSMLRCRFVFLPAPEAQVVELPAPMGRLHLIQEVRVIPDRDGILDALAEPDFDPRRTVILESEPDPAPAAGKPGGTASIVCSDTDTIEIVAELSDPAILLITDAYDKGWRAVALAGSSQPGYQVHPANYVLRAVPLAAGKHHLRLEYAPRSLAAGKWISLASLLVYLAIGIVAISRQIRS